MKINNDVIEITKSYTERNFEIDITNEDNFSRLFSSLINVYSNKFSFIREFVQNAYDAVVEVWELKYKNDIDLNDFLLENPIVVSLFKDNKGTYIEIKETKGIGISPDRIDNMFLFLTKSTKRNSINQIGAKGIGKMAALAYTDEYFLSTVYDGNLYEYKVSWYNQQGIPKLSEPIIFTSNEHNYTAIRVYLADESDVRLVESAITEFLPYFTNIYYHNLEVNTNSASTYDINYKQYYGYYNSTNKKSLNDIKLHVFDTFSYRERINLYDCETFLIVDRIPYRINWQVINMTPMYLPFGIHVSSQDVLLNDNRDSIRYTNSVINHIQQKIKSFNNELLSFVHKGLCSIEQDILKIWNKDTYFKLNEITFKISNNPFAAWEHSYKYIKSLVLDTKYRYDNGIKSILFKVILIKGNSKLFKKVTANYIDLYSNYSSRRKYQFDPVSCKAYLLDTDISLNAINFADIPVKQLTLLNKFNRSEILKFLIHLINDDDCNKVVDSLEKSYNELGDKFSTIYNQATITKVRTDRRNKIKVSEVDKIGYDKYAIINNKLMNINDIDVSYIAFNNTELDKAKEFKHFIKTFDIDLKVILVAPTYYQKIPYNIEYFFNNNEIFKYINNVYYVYTKIFNKLNNSSLLFLSSNRKFIDYVYLFENTIIEKLIYNKHIDVSNVEIYKYIYNINYKVNEFFDFYSKIIDTNLLIQPFIDDIIQLNNIFTVDYPELQVIDYYDNNRALINSLVKIILNKNNCNE